MADIHPDLAAAIGTVRHKSPVADSMVGEWLGLIHHQMWACPHSGRGGDSRPGISLMTIPATLTNSLEYSVYIST